MSASKKREKWIFTDFGGMGSYFGLRVFKHFSFFCFLPTPVLLVKTGCSKQWSHILAACLHILVALLSHTKVH